MGGVGGEKGGETDRHTERERERWTDTYTQREREKDTETETQRETCYPKILITLFIGFAQNQLLRNFGKSKEF